MASTSTSFLNGYSSRKEVLGLLSFPDMLDPNAMFCRFYSYVQGSWGTFDLQFQCKSLTVRIDEKNGYRGWCVLGKNGEIADIAGGNPPRISQISGAGLNVMRPYGYVEAIKQIDGELYVCGYGRQVYKLVDEQWLSISDEILTRERAIGFFDIDGKDERHIYAVGWKGEIYQYDGEDWHKDDSPTTAHLASVRVLGQNEVWICGDKGVVLHGHFNQWTQLGSDAFTGTWYSIESFNGKIYLVDPTFRQFFPEAGADGLGAQGLGWVLPTLVDAKATKEVATIRGGLANRITETAAGAHFVTNYTPHYCAYCISH
jgi:hypothetical protein